LFITTCIEKYCIQQNKILKKFLSKFFFFQLDHSPVEIIDSKAELQGFKRNDVTKVVGFFENTNAAGKFKT